MVISLSETNIRQQVLDRVSQYDADVRQHMPSECNADFHKLALFVFNTAKILRVTQAGSPEEFVHLFVEGDERLSEKLSQTVVFATMQVAEWNQACDRCDFNETIDAIDFNMNANSLIQGVFIGILFHYFEEFFSSDRNVQVVTEGLAEGEPSPMNIKNDSTVSAESLTKAFSGELDRTTLSAAVKQVMERQGLSNRAAAKLVNLPHNDIQRVKDGKASIEKTLDVLSRLGCKLKFEIEMPTLES